MLWVRIQEPSIRRLLRGSRATLILGTATHEFRMIAICVTIGLDCGKVLITFADSFLCISRHIPTFGGREISFSQPPVCCTSCVSKECVSHVICFVYRPMFFCCAVLQFSPSFFYRACKQFGFQGLPHMRSVSYIARMFARFVVNHRQSAHAVESSAP